MKARLVVLVVAAACAAAAAGIQLRHPFSGHAQQRALPVLVAVPPNLELHHLDWGWWDYEKSPLNG